MPGRLPRPFFLPVHAQLAQLSGISSHEARVPGEPRLTWPEEPAPGSTPAAYQRQQPDQSESGHAHVVGPHFRLEASLPAPRALLQMSEHISTASLFPLRRPLVPHRARCGCAHSRLSTRHVGRGDALHTRRQTAARGARLFISRPRSYTSAVCWRRQRTATRGHACFYAAGSWPIRVARRRLPRRA